MADASARRIVFTGASGGIGTMIRPLLAPRYPGLVLSDKVKPKDLLPSEICKRNMERVERDIEDTADRLQGL